MDKPFEHLFPGIHEAMGKIAQGIQDAAREKGYDVAVSQLGPNEFITLRYRGTVQESEEILLKILRKDLELTESGRRLLQRGSVDK